MGTSFDSSDDRHAYIGDIFQHLNAFVVNLAPNAGIGDIAERGPIDIGNKLPTCAREDYDLVRPILRNPVEGLDKFRMSLRAHNERPAVVVELSNQYTLVISRQFQVVISSEVVTLKLHRFLLSVLLTPKMLLVRKDFSWIYAATAVSCAVTGVSWATVDRKALRIATIAFRPVEVADSGACR